MKKKLVSVLLSMAMVATMAGGAFAEDAAKQIWLTKK